MELQPKLVAAITAAIRMYEEMEAMVQEKAPEVLPKEVLLPKPIGVTSPWVISVRQSSMEMRRLLQMRMLK